MPLPTFSQFNLDSVRRTQYAGTWYEGHGDKLKTQLREFLESADSAMKAAPQPVAHHNVLALIAPHAGYIYSGKTAAYSYRATQSPSIKRVFIMGPSHHAALHGIALPSATTFETPLGNLTVDKETVNELKSYPLFSFQPDIHKVEHSLELQLPFIRQTFGDVKIVPLVVGVLKDEAEIRLVAEVLKGFISKGDLIVVSSDFTHYGPRYGYTPFEHYSREKIAQLDKEAYKHLSQADLHGFIDFHNRTEDTICGLFPCAVLCAMLPNDARGHLLKYATSQDVVPDDRDNSVSYLAITFTGTPWPENPSQRLAVSDAIKLSDAEKKTLLTIARRSLETWVKEKKVFDPGSASDIALTPHMKQCFGAFVTLYKKGSDDHEHRKLHSGKELRGCIGNIWPVRPLYQTVVENSIASSSRDPRFDPVRADELKDVQIEISILTPPRRVQSFKDIVLGTDGIILSKNHQQAVFLPQVATEFGWDLPETLRQLSLKAGLKDNDWKEGAQYDLFQSMPLEEH